MDSGNKNHSIDQRNENGDGAPSIGSRVEIYWHLDKVYCPATIIANCPYLGIRWIEKRFVSSFSGLVL